MGFYLEYFCDSGRDCLGNYEGPQGRTRAEVIAAMRTAEWKRVKGGGWFCPECAAALRARTIQGSSTE
jgi:hypothetical protein